MIGMSGEKGAKTASGKQYNRHASGRTDALTTLDRRPKESWSLVEVSSCDPAPTQHIIPIMTS
jgi:hypothetical protein